MYKLLSFALYLLITLHSTQAQTVDVSQAVAGIYLKANPLAMLETDGGIAFSAEYLLAKPRLGFQLEVQPIFFSMGNRKGRSGPEAPVQTLNSGMPLGIEARPELRYYFTFNKQRRVSGRLFRFSKLGFGPTYKSTSRRNYVSVDFLYKYVIRERQSEIGVFNGGTAPAYNQTYTYQDVKQVNGWNIKFGTVLPLSANGHWLLEYYIGFGGRYKTFRYKNLPAGVAPPNRLPVFSFGFSRDNGMQVTRKSDISVPAGLRLVYQL